MSNIKNKLSQVRNFPFNTCPASRHLEIMMNSLAKNKKYHMFDEDSEHCSESIASVLHSLYELRNLVHDLGYEYQTDVNGNSKWIKNKDSAE